ncbi:50S ribosomal protein L18 [Lentisphaera profundi]|uniref:Large ribosomal subunit protein uL18 n=1 Tax=Lentisphaera profundi TaxID=1658616 RepID=A0ABY7VW21_9BACT|nr:50S ribosomal protein L18 [Lentisphaera profundi]WDE98282.1 50S ribosomal protein L18 [Lentisphaera profundi]
MSIKTTKQQRKRRHFHVRKKVAGTAAKPRMAISRSLNHISVQFIDDEAGKTLASASTKDKAFDGTNIQAANKEGAVLVGKIAADNAKAAGISKVVFDRAGFRFHGRVKELADAAREAGLEF